MVVDIARHGVLLGRSPLLHKIADKMAPPSLDLVVDNRVAVGIPIANAQASYYTVKVDRGAHTIEGNGCG